MNRADAARLLTVASGFDRRQVDELTATAWAQALARYEYTECEMAVIQHFTEKDTRHAYLTVGHVLDRVEVARRAGRADVEADVRSAKARGLVEKSWPVRDPLPDAIARRLDALREAERAERAAVLKELA